MNIIDRVKKHVKINENESLFMRCNNQLIPPITSVQDICNKNNSDILNIDAFM